jgi:hypothetical protein
MSNAVDYSGSPEWNPYHLYNPYYGANPTKDDDVEQKENANAKSGVTTVYVALNPIIRSANTI